MCIMNAPAVGAAPLNKHPPLQCALQPCNLTTASLPCSSRIRKTVDCKRHQFACAMWEIDLLICTSAACRGIPRQITCESRSLRTWPCSAAILSAQACRLAALSSQSHPVIR